MITLTEAEIAEISKRGESCRRQQWNDRRAVRPDRCSLNAEGLGRPQQLYGLIPGLKGTLGRSLAF